MELSNDDAVSENIAPEQSETKADPAKPESHKGPLQHPRIIDVTGPDSLKSILDGAIPISEYWKNSKERLAQSDTENDSE